MCPMWQNCAGDNAGGLLVSWGGGAAAAAAAGDVDAFVQGRHPITSKRGNMASFARQVAHTPSFFHS